MTCMHCGTRLSSDSRFCSSCGSPLADAPPQEEPSSAYGGGGAARAVTWTEWVDPSEQAFAVLVPKGWNAQGGVHRPPPMGAPMRRFQALDPSGRVGVDLSEEVMTFSEPVLGGLFGTFLSGFLQVAAAGMYPPLAFHDAVAFGQGPLVERWRAATPDLRVLRAEPSPEARAAYLERWKDEQKDLLAPPQLAHLSVADITIEGGMNGHLMRQGVRVVVQRSATMLGPESLWMAILQGRWFAPPAEFQLWEPLLRRMLEMLTPNPAWVQRLHNQVNQHTLTSHINQQEGLRGISRTISETSDIVTESFWSRQRIHEQHALNRNAMRSWPQTWQQRWSNATLGWEDRYDDDGNHVTVESGHERVWRDPSGAIHVGTQLTNPEPGWKELRLG